MNHYQRGLLLRIILALLGIALAVESYFLSPNLSIHGINTGTDPSSDQGYDSDPGWSSDSYDSGGGGWDFDSGDGGWDSGGGGWDSGGDSGSWDSGGGDSGSW